MPGTERVLSRWAVYICSKGIQSCSHRLFFPPSQLEREMGGSQCDVKEDTYFQVSTMNQTQAEGFLKSEKQIYGRSKQGVQPPIPLWGTWFSQTLRAENIKVSVKVMDGAWDGALPQSPISWIPLPSVTDKPGAKSGEKGANPSELVSFSRITGSGRQTQSSPVFLGPFYPTKQKPLRGRYNKACGLQGTKTICMGRRVEEKPLPQH